MAIGKIEITPAPISALEGETRNLIKNSDTAKVLKGLLTWEPFVDKTWADVGNITWEEMAGAVPMPIDAVLRANTTYTFSVYGTKESMAVKLGGKLMGETSGGVLTFDNITAATGFTIQVVRDDLTINKIKLEKREVRVPYWSRAWEELPLKDKPASYVEVVY